MSTRAVPGHLLTLDAAGFPQAEGQPLKLPPQERAVLRLLMQHASRVVRKDEFAAEAWSGRDMSDETLARSISLVRRVLLPFDVRVQTVYGLGYRLLEPEPPRPRGAPIDAPARDTCAHARQLVQQRTPQAMDIAIDLLRGLVRAHPSFASARVALAHALAVAVGWGHLPTPPAVEEGLAALAPLDDGPGAAEGLHAARGELLDMAWRFDEAEAAFERALAGAEDAETLIAYSRHLLFTDRAARAVERLRRVKAMWPHALYVRITLARALVQSGRGAEAVAEVQAAGADHPGLLLTAAITLAMRAMVAPHPELEAAAQRLTQGTDTPPFVWTVASYVFARLGRQDAALDIVDTALLCSRTTSGEASLYAAPLAALGEFDRAASLLAAAVDERCGMMAMVLRDPAHAAWLPRHALGRTLLRRVFAG
ncbi:MAG: winged helix-turn-helix domain-containing protein [Burkholderiaceae bacterium]